jgi:hypothetical protein
MADLGAIGAISPLGSGSVAVPAGGMSSIGAAMKVVLPVYYALTTDAGIAAGVPTDGIATLAGTLTGQIFSPSR